MYEFDRNNPSLLNGRSIGREVLREMTLTELDRLAEFLNQVAPHLGLLDRHTLVEAVATARPAEVHYRNNDRRYGVITGVGFHRDGNITVTEGYSTEHRALASVVSVAFLPFDIEG